ncbi:MAG TPA: hypothetical protein VFV58_22790 [Blastocatellia bacterium]|jgi:hypothetical protein|nr:hypothetical protein [Blastocatellia bacterium]
MAIAVEEKYRKKRQNSSSFASFINEESFVAMAIAVEEKYQKKTAKLFLFCVFCHGKSFVAMVVTLIVTLSLQAY